MRKWAVEENPLRARSRAEVAGLSGQGASSNAVGGGGRIGAGWATRLFGWVGLGAREPSCCYQLYYVNKESPCAAR